MQPSDLRQWGSMVRYCLQCVSIPRYSLTDSLTESLTVIKDWYSQRLHGQHQLNIKQRRLSRFRADLPSSGRHTDKYLTNDDHIRHLNIICTSWLL